MAVVLAARGSGFGDRTLTAGRLAHERLSADPRLTPARCPALRVTRLPATVTEAKQMRGRLGRA